MDFGKVDSGTVNYEFITALCNCSYIAIYIHINVSC